MDRHVQLTQTLRRIAPIIADACSQAQAKSALLASTEWADHTIYRPAILHRLVGTARWGLAADGLVERGDELEAHGMYCTTSYEQQNQGR